MEKNFSSSLKYVLVSPLSFVEREFTVFSVVTKFTDTHAMISLTN